MELLRAFSFIAIEEDALSAMSSPAGELKRTVCAAHTQRTN
jgi:hypothetical protein